MTSVNQYETLRSLSLHLGGDRVAQEGDGIYVQKLKLINDGDVVFAVPERVRLPSQTSGGNQKAQMTIVFPAMLSGHS